MLSNKFKIYVKKFDWILLVVTLLLLAFGLISLYSIALSRDTGDFFYFNKQFLSALLGLMIFFLVTLIDTKFFRRYSFFFYLLSLFLLAGVLIFGQDLRGTRGWFVIGNWGFQPFEVAKIFLIVFLASLFAKRSSEIKSLRIILVSGFWVSPMIILLLLQPDLGAALVVFFLWLLSLIFLGVRFRYFVVLLLLVSVVAILAWSFLLVDYQKGRIETFFRPDLDPYGRGYNIRQAVIAIGAGRLWGKGLSLGSQSQLKFLPESQNDFIFAVIAEELGLLGVTLFLIFWIVFFYHLIKIARESSDNYAYSLALLIFIVFLTQVSINIGMNLGIMPVVGISLPLVSGGGSGLISALILVGLAQNLIVRRRNS